MNLTDISNVNEHDGYAAHNPHPTKTQLDQTNEAISEDLSQTHQIRRILSDLELREARITSLTPPIDNDQATGYNDPPARISHERRDGFKYDEQQQKHLELIIKAIEDGNFDRFSQLINGQGESIKKLLNVHIRGQTALHHSILHGRDIEWCRQLVDNGANPNLNNLQGWHPLHLAAHTGSSETMLFLLDYLQ